MDRSASIYRENIYIASDIKFADSFLKRLRGLMLRKTFDSESGLLLRPCRRIHTYFMRTPIDAIFVSDSDIVVHVEKNLKPNKLTKYHRRAEFVLEMPAGKAEIYNIKAGDRLNIEENESVEWAFE
mgnify:CR=1 FL=1